MKPLLKTMLTAALLFGTALSYAQTYVPSAENLEARKELEYQRFGIFLHWGIYSTYGQGEWYLRNGRLQRDEYAKAASAFYPAYYNAREWVRAFKDAGALYVTVTSRHHDGFSMFRTGQSAYNIVDATPLGRDVIAELADACHEEGLALQFYYSLLDWMRDDYPAGGTVWETSGKDPQKADYPAYFAFMKRQVRELLEQYAPVRALWFDGWWDHPKDFDWKMREFYDYIHGLQSSCLIGNNHHIAPLEGEDYQMFEKDLPGQNTTGFAPDQQVSVSLPLEMCETMNRTWGYSVSDRDYKAPTDLIRLLARLVSMNSNLLLNIGPQADGRLPQDALDRLKVIGGWMRVNAEAIRGCGPGPMGEQEWGVTTAPKDDPKVFYLHIFQSPGAMLELPFAGRRVASVTPLAGGEKLPLRKMKDKCYVTLPASVGQDADDVFKVTLK